MSRDTKLDANQVIKRVYDDENNALVVVGLEAIVRDLSSATDSVTTALSVVDTTTLLNAVDATVDQTSVAVNILGYNTAGVMVNWAALASGTPSLKFQGSLDSTVWEDIGSAYSITGASGHKGFSLIDEPYKFFRVVYAANGASAGTLTTKYILRQ